MTALEALRWHENAARSPSDESILSQRSRFGLVEKRPAPAEMTDSEMLDFIDEYVDLIQQTPATSVSARKYIVGISGVDDVRANTLREAVCLAKAYFDEANK